MTYSEAQRKATYKYREKHRETYNATSRESYKKNCLNPEWKAATLLKQRSASKKYRDKQRLKKSPSDESADSVINMSRGRPRRTDYSCDL